MDLGAFDLNTLGALVALLEEGNLTQAGAKVGMAQPAMSGVLGRYRRHFEDELLVRVGRDYELTPLARELVPQLQEALRLMRNTLRVGETFDPATSNRTFTVTASDYAMTILLQPLRRLVRQHAPQIRLEFADLAEERLEPARMLLRYDLVVAPRGHVFHGDQRLLFRDRLVCLVDRDNPHLREGRLGPEALRAMPHAETAFRGQVGTVVERVLGQHGIERRIALQSLGFLLLPFAVPGTEAVAIVPERLARRFLPDGRLAVLDLPFGSVDMLESAWWHRSRAVDPGHRWFVGLLGQVAAELAIDDPAGVLPAAVSTGDVLPGGRRPAG